MICFSIALQERTRVYQTSTESNSTGPIEFLSTQIIQLHGLTLQVAQVQIRNKHRL